jgi:DNA-directed RNA polymerase specialized sigma24 family protein
MINSYASWWRRRWRGEVPTATLPETAATGPDLAGAAATRDSVRRALARFSRQQRAVVVLRYAEDLSVEGPRNCSAARRRLPRIVRC